MREIYIRKLRYEQARRELEQGLNDAFMAGESQVRVVHGIGEGRLSRMVDEVVASYDFAERAPGPGPRQGSTLLHLYPPDRRTLRILRK